MWLIDASQALGLLNGQCMIADLWRRGPVTEQPPFCRLCSVALVMKHFADFADACAWVCFSCASRLQKSGKIEFAMFCKRFLSGKAEELRLSTAASAARSSMHQLKACCGLH